MRLYSYLIKLKHFFVLQMLLSCSAYCQNLGLLVSPKNNVFLNDSLIVFEWNQIQNATSYSLTISNNISFASPLEFSNLTSTQKTIPLNENATYYWFIRYNNIISDTFNFKLISPGSYLPSIWYNADSAKITGGLVDSLFDLSSNFNNAFSTLAKPVIVNDPVTNKNVIEFSGPSAQPLSFPLMASNNFSFFLIANPEIFNRSYEVLLSNNGSSSIGSRWAMGMGGDLTAGAGWAGTNSALELGSAGFLNLNSLNCVSYLKSSSAWTIKNNSNTIRIVNDTSLPTYSGTHDWSIGTESANDGYRFTGTLAEILIFQNNLDSVSSFSIEQHLMQKYAPPVNLGPDILTCTLPDSIDASKTYFKSYMWNDGSTNSSLPITADGKYYVTVTTIFDQVSSDTILIKTDTSHFSNTLVIDTAICQGQSFNYIVGPTHYSYTWDDSSSQNFISANSSGTYAVSYQNCFGQISSDTFNVDVRPLPLFNFGSDTIICYNSGFLLDPGFINSSPLVFNWFDATHDSIHDVSHSGAYFLTVANSIGCSFSDTISIQIDSSLSSASLGPDASLCAGNSIYLQTDASIATGYTWSDLTTNDSLQVFFPGPYWVTVTNINNCTATDTINISIAGNAPDAEFLFTNSCLGNATTFTDTSIPPSGDTLISWDWNFGDASFSTIQNPSHIYTDTGTYVVSLKVTTNAGCSESINRIIHVYPYPAIGFSAPGSLCEDAGALFTESDTTFGYSITSWSWNFADPGSGVSDTSSSQNPGHYFNSGGNYLVKLIAVNIKGCADTVINNIVIKPGPVADFTNSLPCFTIPVQFTNTSTLPSGTTLNASFWNFGDATANSALLNPSHNYSAGSVFNVMHIVTASNGCKDTVIHAVTINPKPIAAFSPADGCLNVPVLFSDLSSISSGSINAWAWTFDATGSSVLQNPQYAFVTAGTASVKLIVISDKGCKDTAIQAVTIHSNPAASFTENPNYGNPPLSVNFTNTTPGAADFIWNFGDGSDTSHLVDPVHIYADTGSYQISLAAINAFGCSDTAYYSLNVEERLMDVAVASFSTTVQNNFLNINAVFENHGTTDVHNMEIYVKINDGSYIRLYWGGLLPHKGSVNYSFTTSLYIDDKEHYVCVSIQKPNGSDDEVPENNELCNSIDVGKFQVFDPFPNPAHDLITLPVFIPGSDELSIIAYNASGEKAAVVFSGTIDEGFYTISFNTLKLAEGMYVLKINYKDQSLIKKIIKN